MRFERLVIDRYGPLREMDTGEAPLPGLVGVWGPNEAGKTSLFSFLGCMLYGFHPASRDGNPYTPWSGGDIEGQAVIRADSGERVRVHRRLLSSGWGRLTHDSREEDLRNRPLELARHMPRALFHQIYALALSELAGLERESWQTVQDRLMGGMGASDLVPARQAAATLLEEAAALWRDDNRGRPLTRTLTDELGELHRQRREAEDRDERLRQAVRELDEARTRMAEARAERADARTTTERVRILLPVRRQLIRLAEIEETAGTEDHLEGLPTDPAARLVELDREIGALRRKLDGLDAAERDPALLVAAFDAPARRVLDAVPELERLIQEARVAEQEGQERARLAQELRDVTRRCESLGHQLFSDPWTEIDVGTVEAAASGNDVRRRIEEFGAAQRTRTAREEALRWLDRPDPERGADRRPPRLTWWTLAFVGAVLSVLGAIGGAGLVLAAGLAATVVSAVALAFHRGAARGAAAAAVRERRAAREGPETLEDSRAAEAAALRRVREALADLPLRPAWLESPSLELPTALRRFRDLTRDRDERAEGLDRLVRRSEEIRTRTIRVADRLGLTVPPDPGATAYALEREIREAERRRDRAASARRELEAREADRAELREGLERAEHERSELEARIEALTGAPGTKGLPELAERLDARDLARRIREELHRTYPNLEDLRIRILEAEAAGESWTLDEDALGALAAREEELSDRVEKLRGVIERLEMEVDQLSRVDTVDQIEGGIAEVLADLAEAARERDRKFVLATIIQEADRRFREEHQPEVIRRAGEYLSTITGGRYQRLLVSENDDGEVFRLRGPGFPHAVPVAEPISTGTREQVYLALRLAIVDHLDEGAERLPLFMDEAFVNWDRERRDRGFRLLEELSARRQLFLFTCHESVAEALAERGAHLIRLPGPS